MRYFFFLFIFSALSCKKTIIPPTIRTLEVTDIFARNAQSGGVITNEGSSKVTIRGVVWSTAQSPTISLSTKTTDGQGIGTYTSKVTGLSANTKYYIRAYATTASGTSYGNEVSFTTNDINLTNGLMAYYPFTVNAGDSSGNNNHGVMYGLTSTTDRFGKQNMAFEFNGTNSYIEVNDSESLRPKKISISAWYYTSFNNSFQCIVSRAIDQYYFDLYTSSVVVNSNCSPNATQLFLTPFNSSMFTLNKWVNLVTTWDGVNLKTYKDGIEMKGAYFPRDQTVSGDMGTCVLGKLRIGRWSEVFPRAFNGKLDEIRIYNRSLSQSEITYLANN